MRPHVHLYRSRDFMSEELPIYVNRAIESFDLRQHAHEFLEICYVGEGKGYHYVGETGIAVARGDIFLLPRGVTHVFRPSSATASVPLVVYNCVIGVDALDHFLAAFPGGDALRGLAQSTAHRQYRDRHGEFHSLFQQLHYEYMARRPGRTAALYSTVMLLLLYLLREDAQDQADAQPASAAVEAGMAEVLHHLHAHAREPVRLSDLAARLGVGARQFHRLFTRQTGMTLRQYVQTVRIDEACRLLVQTHRSIGEIAAAVGYQDMPHFNRLFKRMTGDSPRDYRKRSRS
ncbi:AraC family transcriptional regulator [Paenibacillus sabuli]|nr:AraC family transcriptional regulator [Paenibacillus sabuli]